MRNDKLREKVTQDNKVFSSKTGKEKHKAQRNLVLSTLLFSEALFMGNSF